MRFTGIYEIWSADRRVKTRLFRSRDEIEKVVEAQQPGVYIIHKAVPGERGVTKPFAMFTHHQDGQVTYVEPPSDFDGA